MKEENQLFIDILEIICRLDDSPKLDVHFQNKCYTATQKIVELILANQ